ncbi:hypothetical protein Pst134EB_029973 [Puccinia striiformis f. sp. tritici]|uniref:Uncharacterized protein n=1 Tax=Puccinia striiformis f. sp. tritici PST-78 TaxID=1165861 RepID=A0A0L0V9P6_9BASI|nr:hypothetical protein Pst134EB_029973 [Puccinia striiformis f. sp. tritici]KNE96002.1 hypothetical protein PSTG_10693 [Puccinia striiformis f. sp. tritici PST-78]
MANTQSGSSGRVMKKIEPQDEDLCFTGTNVERFLEDFELAAELDGACEYDMARQLHSFIKGDDIKEIFKTLDGYKPPDWTKLKASMIEYWGQVDTAKFTARDLDNLVIEWRAKGGVSSAVDYHEFRQVWEPIQSYLISKKHIDSEEEIRNSYYQSFLPNVQDDIRKHMILNKTIVTTLDNRFKLPTFAILKGTIKEVMKGQTALTFEDSKAPNPAVSPFKASNETMKKMGEAKRPKEAASTSKPATSVDKLAKMLQSFEQKLDAKIEQFLSQHSRTTDQSSSRPTIVCYYCLCENHGTGRFFELKKDKDNKLVTQQGNNFFLPNGALIPFDPSRPIRHVVASYTPPRASVSFAETEFKSSCGLLQPWYPPAVSSQSFAGVYEADPAGRKRHEEPKPYKAPAVPPAATRRTPRKPVSTQSRPESEAMEEEQELFDGQPKARFERGVAREHPNAVEDVLQKISDLNIPGITVSELMALAPPVAEGMKRWVSRRRVEVGQEELKVHSGTLVEDSEPQDPTDDPNLYSCPLGYLSCLIGDGESPATPLIDSGSQLNIISDALATKFNISPRVNFSSAVYGINNQVWLKMSLFEWEVI